MSHRYPAPYDPPDHKPVEITDAPRPPIYCGPPLPVEIPVEKVPALPRPSIYRDLFGSDLSVLADTYGASWASGDQRLLAGQILDGQKSINTLSPQELDLLDDLAVRYNHGGSPRETVPSANRERLRVPSEEAARGQAPEAMPPAEEHGVQPEVSPNIAGAYGWLGGEDGDK